MQLSLHANGLPHVEGASLHRFATMLQLEDVQVWLSSTGHKGAASIDENHTKVNLIKRKVEGTIISTRSQRYMIHILFNKPMKGRCDIWTKSPAGWAKALVATRRVRTHKCKEYCVSTHDGGSKFTSGQAPVGSTKSMGTLFIKIFEDNKQGNLEFTFRFEFGEEKGSESDSGSSAGDDSELSSSFPVLQLSSRYSSIQGARRRTRAGNAPFSPADSRRHHNFGPLEHDERADSGQAGDTNPPSTGNRETHTNSSYDEDGAVTRKKIKAKLLSVREKMANFQQE
ncbi:hypothetical protein K439DRAFT_1632343, partial [Ramaria rubella]